MKMISNLQLKIRQCYHHKPHSHSRFRFSQILEFFSRFLDLVSQKAKIAGIAALVLGEIKRAIDQRDFWERDEREGGP